MIEKLNVTNFFHIYALAPRSKELSEKDRNIALLGTILLGLTLGMGHFVCYLLSKRKIAKQDSQTSTSTSQPNALSETRLKTKGVASDVLPSQPSPPPITPPPKDRTVGGAKSGPTTPDEKKEGKNAPAISPTFIPPSEQSKEQAPEQDVGIQRPASSIPTFEQWESTEQDRGIQQPELLPPLGPVNLPVLEEKINLLYPAGIQEEGKAAKEEMFRKIPYDRWERDIKQTNYYGNNGNFLLLEKRINERIDELDKAIQFRKRVKALQEREGSAGIQMGDLEVPWKESALSIAFLSKEEIGALTFEEIEKFSPRQLQILRERAKSLRFPSSDLPPNQAGKNLTFQTILSLVEIKSSDWSKIPDSALSFLSDQALKNADFSSLPKGRLAILFPLQDLETKRKIQLCSSKVSKSISLFLPEYARFLTKEQIQAIDFNRIDQTMFDALFPPLNDLAREMSHSTREMGHSIRETREGSKVKEMTKEQLAVSYAKGFFDGKRLACLSDDSLKDFNFSVFLNEKSAEDSREIVENLFEYDTRKVQGDYIKNRNEVTRRIGLLSSENFLALLPFLLPKFRELIPKERIQTIDFTRIDQTIFDALFPPLVDLAGEMHSADSILDIREKSRIKELKPEQLDICYESGFFDGKRIGCLPDEELKAISFSRLLFKLSLFQQKEIVGEIFEFEPEQVGGKNLYNQKEISRRLGLLHPREMSNIFPFLSEKLIKLIPQDKIPALNFYSNEDYSSEQVEALFPLPEVADLYRRPDSPIHKLKSDQIYALRRFLNPMHFFLLTDEQLKEIDFNKLFSGLTDLEKQTIAEGLFDTNLAHFGGKNQAFVEGETKRRFNLLQKKNQDIIRSVIKGNLANVLK